MRIGRIQFTSIQKDNFMKPTRNRIFCPQCKRPKMLFESQKKADNFIEFNKSEIEENNNYAPCRSYYCPFCAGWHVTHHQNFDESRVESIDIYIENCKNCNTVKTILPYTEEKVEDILNEVKQIMKEGDYEACLGLLLSAKNLIETFRNNGTPTNRQFNSIERYVIYKKKVNARLGISDIEETSSNRNTSESSDNTVLTISRANCLIDEVCRILKSKTEVMNIEDTLDLCQDVCDANMDNSEIDHLRNGLCTVCTILACRKDLDAIADLKEIDDKVLEDFIQDKFKELELGYIYREYSSCTAELQDLFKLYQMIAARNEYSDRAERFREELYRWVEKLQQALQ